MIQSYIPTFYQKCVKSQRIYSKECTKKMLLNHSLLHVKIQKFNGLRDECNKVKS